MKNYYEILGVSFEATDKEIRNAYGEKIKKYKPTEYPEEYKKITEAYKILKNSNTRREYDAKFKHGNEIEKYRADAGRALDNEDYKTAIELYKKILSLEPELAPIKSMLARALLWSGQGDLAINEIKEAISLDSKNPLYYHDMGWIYRTLGDNNKAEKSYLKAYMLDESNYDTRKTIVDFYTDNKRYENAVFFLDKCTGKDSDNLFKDFSYLIEMINVYIKSNDAGNISKIKKIVDRIKEITPENKQKDVALKLVDLVYEALKFENERIIRTLCDSVFEFDKDNEQIKELLNNSETDESKSQESTQTTSSQSNQQANNTTNTQTNYQSNSRQEQDKPPYNMNNLNIQISNFEQIKTLIIGCITLVICGAIGLTFGIGVAIWLFAIVPLSRKYNIEKHNKYNIPKLSLAHQLLGYVIIMGTCIFNVESNIIGGRTENSRMIWGYILGYAVFCLFLRRFPGLGITKNSGTKIKTKKIEIFIEEMFNSILGIFGNKSRSYNTSAASHNNQSNELDNQGEYHEEEQENQNEATYKNKRKPQKRKNSNDEFPYKKALIAILIIVVLLAAPTVGYVAASKLQGKESKTQTSSNNSTNTQIKVTDFEFNTSTELKYVGDRAVININKIYPSNVDKNKVEVSVSSNNTNVIVASDTNIIAVGEGKATITIHVSDIKKSFSLNIIKNSKDANKQNNYLRKESDSSYLTYDSLYNLSSEELMFIKNEIYARHGYIFTEQPYKAYFNSQNWYKGTKKVVSENELNKYEISNVDLIVKILNYKQLNSNNSSGSPSNNVASNNAINKNNTGLINVKPTQSEFICKNIDLIYLTENDLSVLDSNGLAMLRNEVYARRGYIFKEEPYKTYFNNKTWYRATTDNVPDEMLNNYEFANVKLIQKLEKNN